MSVAIYILHLKESGTVTKNILCTMVFQKIELRDTNTTQTTVVFH